MTELLKKLKQEHRLADIKINREQIAKHIQVVQAAGSILGKKFESLTRQFNGMRQKRNKLIYDIGGLVSHEEAKTAFKGAEKYLDEVKQIMENEDPQLKLDLS